MDSPWFISQWQLNGDKISDKTQSYNPTIAYGKGFWL